ncbi:MAG: DUF4150 domain-containing protein [Myxococcales bacterium]|nr:DUF4150 domain-containing protein [Myxococcales bacterium]MBL8717809.1 DUF4150 domain-containing protein [Myxococcales bacterium]
MFPASTTAGGMCFAMPDVCLTPAPPAPPVPIPYPNLAQCAQATSTTTKVLIQNKPVIVEMSKIPQSSGDEAGTNGGVMSGMNRGEVAFKLGSSKVMMQGKKVCFITSLTAHNGASPNAPAGAQIAPSQAKVIVAP